MSFSFTLSLAGASRTLDTLACALAFSAVVGCHYRASVAAEPSSTERLQGGYGERLPEQSGGTVRTVSTQQANTRAARQVEELLDARFPGVQIIRTASGGFLVRIRGLSSFLGRGEPLYVIDGTPVEVDPNRGLDWINPSDIARITVLTGPPETTLYGVRGANGVIVITTRIR
jgi:TonB-dependent SusC/RagA subfamily outer membrane receptor